MPPARQRLEADDLARAGVELHLIVGNDLAALQPELELFGQATLGSQIFLQLPREEFDAVASKLLGLVERQVGFGQEVTCPPVAAP